LVVGIFHDPDLHDPSGRWRERGGVGGVSTGPWRSWYQEFHDPDLDDPSGR